MRLVSTWVKGLTLLVLFSLFSISFAAPIAKITGPDVILTGETVTLNGASSLGKSLKYSWKMLEAPAGSSAQILNANTSKIYFVANRAGKYEVELRVQENNVWSAPQKLILHSVVSAGEAVFKSEEYSASFICKISLGYYGCEDIVHNFDLEDSKGNYSVVIENNGANKATISLNGVELNRFFNLNGNDETSSVKMSLKAHNQIRVAFKRNGMLGNVGGSFQLKILKNGKLSRADLLEKQNLTDASEPTRTSTSDANQPPAPTAKSVKTLQNTQGVTRIFPNDTDANQRIIYSVLAAPDHGSVVVTSEGLVYYVPNPNYYGSDRVIVQVKDDGSPSLSRNITIPVIVEQNYSPNPSAENIVTIQGAAGQTQIVANDPNTIPQKFIYEVSTPAENGAVSIYGTRIVYRPNIGFTGTDSFVVKVTDDGTPALSGYKTINVTVNPNTIPSVAANDIVTFQSKPVTTQVTYTDPDPGQGHWYEIATAPAHGVANINSQGVLSYTPSVGYYGDDSVTVAVKDSAVPAGVGTRTIAITVSGNAVPVLIANDLTTYQNKAVTSQVSYTDADTNQRHTYNVVSQPAHGRVLLTQQGVLTYTPAKNYLGADSFVISVSDNAIPVGTDQKTIHVNVNQNTIPVVAANDITVSQGVIGTTQVSYTDPDVGQSHYYSVATPPAHGTVTLSQDGLLNYSPYAGFSGSDTVVVAVSDNANPPGMGTKAIHITVVPTSNTNTVPAVAASDINTTQNTTGTTQVTYADPDVGQTHTFSVTTQGIHGNATINQDGLLTYTPANGYTGTDSVAVAVTDSANPPGVGTKIIHINIVAPPNAVPVVAANDITTQQGTNGTTQVTYADPDVGQTHTFSVTTQGAHGNTTINQDGLLTYTPANGYTGTDLVVVAVTDSANPPGVGTKIIHINIMAPPNTVPVVAANDITTQQGTNGTTQVTYTDPDAGQTHTFAVVSQPAHGSATINTDGLLTYTPAATYSGSDSVVVSVTDSATTPGVGTKVINIAVISNINSIPVVAGDDINIFQAAEGSSHITYVDPDVGQNHSVSIFTNAAHGFAFIDPLLQNAVYHPTDRCQALNDSFVVAVTDNANPPGVGTKTINVNVTPNTKPTVIANDLSIEQNQTITEQVQVTDPDANEHITYEIKKLPQFGFASISSTGLITYTHMSVVSSDTDSFQISVRDNFGECAGGEVVKTVNVHIQSNRAPTLNVANIHIEQGTVSTTTATGLDQDQYQTLTYGISAQPNHGTLEVTAIGAITYTPATGFFGTDQFTVYVRDNGQPILQTEKVVHVNVEPFNTPPSPTAHGIALLTGTTATTTISPGDPDVSQTHTYEVVSTPAYGTATVNELGVLSYTAHEFIDENEKWEEVQVKVTDNGIFPKSTIVYVAIDIVKNLPPAPADVNIAKVINGMSIHFTVAPNDPNEARFPGHYQFTIANGPGEGKGTTSVTTSGEVTYNAPSDYTGDVHFDVLVADDGIPSAVGTARVTIHVGANSQPVVADKALTTQKNTGFDQPIAFTDEDASIQTFTYSTITGAEQTYGTTSIHNGILHYQPADDFVGTDHVYVQVTDNGTPALSGVGVYTITVQDNGNGSPNVSSFDYTISDVTPASMVDFRLNDLADPDSGDVVQEVRVNFGDGTETLVLNRNNIGPQSPIENENNRQILDRFHHFYRAMGTYEVYATLVDNHGAQRTVHVQTVISPNTPPTLGVSFSSVQGPAPLSVGIDASKSTDSDGVISRYILSVYQASFVSLEVSFPGAHPIYELRGTGIPNGSFPLPSAIAGSPYIIELCLIDNKNGSSCQKQYIYPGTNRPDSGSRSTYAKITSSVKQGDAPLTISLSGAGSKATQTNSIVSYNWTIEGVVSEANGQTFKTYLSGMNNDVTLPAGGVYKVRLTVLDSAGNSGYSETKVLVDSPDKSEPEVIVMYYGPQAYSLRLETHGTLIDPDDVWWDVDNGFGHTYSQYLAIWGPASNSTPGPHVVKLQAYDVTGHLYVITKTIDNIFTKPGPQIHLSNNVSNIIHTNEIFGVDASGTTDENGPITFTWNFGDGTPAVSGTGSAYASISHAYATKGSKHLELRVTNSYGISSVWGEDIFVYEGNLPQFDYTDIRPRLGIAPHPVFATASASVNGGSILWYTWNFGQFKGGQLVTGNNLQTTYYRPGYYPVTVIAHDSFGNDFPSDLGSVQVVDYNYAPIVANKAFIIGKNKTLTYDVEFTDNDQLPQLHTFTISQQPAHGTATINANGRLTYTPSTDYTGPESLKVKVTDGAQIPANGEGTITISITDTAESPNPTFANLDYGYANDSYPREVSLWANTLADPPNGKIVKVVWNFGDGTPPATVTRLMFPTLYDIGRLSHLYMASGSYNATATAYTDLGESITQNLTLSLSSNVPPLPVFTAQVTSVSPYNIVFDGTSSTDNDGHIESYCLVIRKSDASVVANQCSSNPVQSLTMNDPGVYYATFMAQDNDHGIGVQSFELNLNGQTGYQNIPSYALMRTADSRLGTGPLTIDWEAMTSAYNGKTIQKKLWTFSNLQLDGNWGSGDNVSFVYSQPGTHYPTLYVIDSDGNHYNTSEPVFVGPAPALQAGFTIQYSPFSEIGTFGFNAETWSTGHIPDFYLWDFGDGTIDFGRYVYHTYKYPVGKYKISLTVMDLYGNFSTVSQIFNGAQDKDTISVDAQGKFVGQTNTPTTLTLQNVKSIYTVKWAFGDGQFLQGDGTTANQVNHTYTSPGVYHVHIAVMDPEFGRWKEYTRLVTILDGGVINPNLDMQLSRTPNTMTVNFQLLHNSSFVPTKVSWMLFSEDGPIAYFDTPNFSYTFSDMKNYSVEVVAKDDNGITDLAGYDFAPQTIGPNNKMKLKMRGPSFMRKTNASKERNINLMKVLRK